MKYYEGVLHFTQCGNCRRLIALSDSRSDKTKLIPTEYRTHVAICEDRYGQRPKMIRYEIL